ncbi:hypothetical protein Leryth_024282 [Lithospermum erythrorhizon]|nr:hypothetical protein Leryth_024282 [Lithospermum erythrorhizon]
MLTFMIIRIEDVSRYTCELDDHNNQLDMSIPESSHQLHPVLRNSFSFVDPFHNLNTEGYSWDQACSTGPLMLSDQDPDENFIFPTGMFSAPFGPASSVVSISKSQRTERQKFVGANFVLSLSGGCWLGRIDERKRLFVSDDILQEKA